MPAQILPIAHNFAGLNRMVSPQNLPESQSPDTTDTRSAGLRAGALGPRNGRFAEIRVASYYLKGMATYDAVSARLRVLAASDYEMDGSVDNGALGGRLITQYMQWPNLPVTGTIPGALTGRHSFARYRFLQYKQRFYAFNGRDRMRNLDGVAWQFAGITKPDFVPSVGVSAQPANLTIISQSISGDVATLTTSAAHGYQVGDVVTVSINDPTFNGTWVITAVTTTTFSYSVGTGSTASSLSVLPILQVEKAAQLVTLTIQNHGFSVGDYLTLSVTSPSGFSDDVEVFALPDPNTVIVYVHYTLTGSVSVTAAGGGSTATLKGAPVSRVTNASSVVIAGGITTVTTGAPHNVSVGQHVSATSFGAGTEPADLAGVDIVTGVTSTTFTFTNPASGDGALGAHINFDVYASGTSQKIIGPTGTYYYFVTASNSKHLDVIGRPIESIPSSISVPIILDNRTATITNIPATHEDPQVDTFNIYRNKNGDVSSDLTSDQQDFFLIGSVSLGTTSYTDAAQDFTLTGADRLRFDQNIPPTFKFAQIYGERMFGAGFDPVTLGAATVNDDPTLIDFDTVNLADGIRGAWFQADGDVNRYRIITVPGATQIKLDRAFVGGLAAGQYAIYRYPWEIYFSEFEDVEAWGPDGEGLRFMISVPGQQAVTGLCEWQGVLLVFTRDKIYAITGKGPNLTDVRLLPDAIFNGLGALSHDSIVRVENDVFFMSSRGPCAMVAGAAPQLVGVILNTDWLDKLTTGNQVLACSGTDDRDVYFAVPDALNHVQNSKMFRYERYTQTWWEETGACPMAFMRCDTDYGAQNVLYYLCNHQAVRVNSGVLDITAVAYTGVPTSSTANTVTNSAAAFDSTVIGAVVRLYTGGSRGKLVASRLITGASGTVLVWGVDTNFPLSGDVDDAFDYYEVGTVAWQWLSKTFEVPGKLNTVDFVHVTFDAKVSATVTLQKTDVVDGVESSAVDYATTLAKAVKRPAEKVNRDYAVRVGSRTGAVIRHVSVEGQIEADIKP